MADNTTLTAELSQRIILPLTADNIDAVGDRTARAKIAALEASLANILAQVQILQGGFRTVYFASAAYSVTEGNSGTTLLTATMKRTGDLSQALAVPAKFVQGTLTASDFVGGTLPGDLVFNFVAGADTATASDQIKGDTEVEGTETLTRVIVPPPGYLFGPTPSYTGSVLNDDTATTPANGDMSALRVRDATPMDTHDNGTNVVGIDGNGWIAEVTIKGMTAPAPDNTSDGFFNCQRLELLVADPGFRGSGSSITTATVYRKIKGRALLRKQYKTQSTDVNGRFISQSGSDFTVLVALADVIYAGSTIVSAKVAAGFYTNGSAVSNASVANSLTNASTYAYRKPTAAWLNHQHLRATSDFPVEMIAFHRHAMGGRQVAGIRFQARDTTGNVSTEQVATATSLSAFVTASGAPKVEAFKATIPVSALAQGELCYANAKVYPWIGDASAVYDLSVDGTYTGLTRIVDASPHTRLRFFNDKAGTYSGVAYLDANATGTGAVAATLASAKSTPYATVQAAFAGIKAYNAARGHDDYAGGRIYLGNNSGSTIEYGPTANIPNASAPGATWCEILVDPAITAPVKWTGKGTVIAIPSMTRAVGLTIKPGGTNQTTFQDGDTASNASMLSLESCVYEAPSAGFNIAGGEGIRGWSIQYRSNVTSTLGNVLNLVSGGTTVQGLALALGNVQPQGGQPAPAQIFVANRSECPTDANSAMPAYTDGYFWVSNEWRYPAGPALSLLSKTRPTVLVNNLGEARGNNSTIIAFNMAADGITAPVYELLDMHNTFVGNRGSRMYSDRAESRGVVKEGVSIGSVYGNYNFKTDSFDPTQNGSGLPGNTGNWRYGYQVGTRSNISLSGSLGGSVPNLQASYLGMAWEPDYSTYLVSSTFANVAALFVDYQAMRNDQSGYPGGGNYHAASSTNALANRTPAAFASFNADFTDTINGAPLSRDLDGNVRRTDGTGAAGCYES